MKKALQRSLHKMNCLILLSQQMILCITLVLMKFVPVCNALPFLSTKSTSPMFGNIHSAPSEQLKPHTSFHISKTANFHIQPTNVKQITPTKLTNLIAASTEVAMNSKSDVNHQLHQHEHKHRHLTQSLKGSDEYQWHQSTKFKIEPTPTQVQPVQTKMTHFGSTNSQTSFSTVITFTEVLSDFPKLSTSSSVQTFGDTMWRGMTTMFPKDLKISKTATSIGIKASIIPMVYSPQEDPGSRTLQQTSTTTTPRLTPLDILISDQTTQDITTPQKLILQASKSTTKHLNLEITLKPIVNRFSNTTEESSELDTNNQTIQNVSLFKQDRNTLSTEVTDNKTISSFFVQPTPSTNNNLLIPQLKTKNKPSHFSNPLKHSTQRPPRNILSLDMRGHSRWRSSKALIPSRSGLLHLTEDDPPTSYAYKPLKTNKKGFTSLPRNTNGRILAAVTTEFMKSSEMIPDLFVAPTKTQKTHSTRSPYEGQRGAVFTAFSSVTAALSFKSKDESLILSATATLSPSRMTYTCTIPCSLPGCSCCQDKQLAPVTATTAVTGQPPSNATPNIEVSTNKSLTEQISLSARFGIGMGCLIAIWLVVGPVVCLICRIRDKVKEGEDDVDEIEKRKKKPKEKSTGTKKEHPLTEAIVMDELNKQFSKKKNIRENEYLLLAKDKAELECLSRADISKTITKKTMSTFDQTRSPQCLNKWDESDVEDDSEEDEKDRLTPVSNTPTVSV